MNEEHRRERGGLHLCRQVACRHWAARSRRLQGEGGGSHTLKGCVSEVHTHVGRVWAFSVRKRGEATGCVRVKVQPSHALSPDCASLSPISLKLAAGTHDGMDMRGVGKRTRHAALGVATWLGVRAMPARRRAMAICRVARRRYPLHVRRDRVPLRRWLLIVT